MEQLATSKTGLHESISSWALGRARKFVIDHKSIFEKAIIAYAAILPEYTRENCNDPNTKILFDVEDKFWEFYSNPGKEKLFKAGWKIAKFENEHDPHYRDIVFGWLVEEIVEAVVDGEWTPRPVGHPSGFWKEPRIPGVGNYGKYKGRKFKKYIDTIPEFRNIYEKLKDIFDSKLSN